MQTTNKNDFMRGGAVGCAEQSEAHQSRTMRRYRRQHPAPVIVWFGSSVGGELVSVYYR